MERLRPTPFVLGSRNARGRCLSLSGDAPTIDLDFGSGVLPTGSTQQRLSGGSRLLPSGYICGYDTSITSMAIAASGSKTFTLASFGSGVDRGWQVGDRVYVSSSTNSANYMVGNVTAYDSSTQSMTITVSNAGGSGTLASWIVGYAGPRFDFGAPATLQQRGILVEAPATNYYQQSNDLTALVWTKSGLQTVTAAAGVTDPFGGARAWQVTAAAASGFHYVRQLYTFASAKTQCVSWLVRPNGYTKCVIGEPGGGRCGARFDLTAQTATPITGVVAPTAGIIALPNSWYLIWMAAQFTAANYGLTLVGYPDSGATVNEYGAQYTGDGSSGICAIGAQLEDGAYPSSRILTLGATVARTVDQYSIPITAGQWGVNAGTFAAQWAGIPLGAIACAAATFEDYLLLSTDEATITLGGSDEAYFGGPGNIPGRMAMAWSAGEAACSLNGGAVSTQAPSGFPTPATLYIGGNAVNGLQPNAILRRIQAWNTRQPNSLLQAWNP